MKGKNMIDFRVALSVEEWQGLIQAADRELRTPEAQLRLFLIEQLTGMGLLPDGYDVTLSDVGSTERFRIQAAIDDLGRSNRVAFEQALQATDGLTDETVDGVLGALRKAMEEELNRGRLQMQTEALTGRKMDGTSTRPVEPIV